jgi:phage terminase large subunit
MYYIAYPYQLPLLDALDDGATRAVACWHRRAGKDKVCLNYMARQTQQRVGAYFYCYPEYNQGKKAIWDGMDRDGFPYLAHFPKPLIKAIDNGDMKLTLTNGSIFQMVVLPFFTVPLDPIR